MQAALLGGHYRNVRPTLIKTLCNQPASHRENMQQHEAPVEGTQKVVILEMTAEMVKSALCGLCTVCSSPAWPVSVTVAECQGAACWC